MEQDDEIDDQEDEQDVEYTEDDSNNNPEQLEETVRTGDNTSHSMPNENINDAANSAHDAQNTENHTTSEHLMKNSQSDEEFFGGPSSGMQIYLFFPFNVNVIILIFNAGGFGHTSDGNTRGMLLQGHDYMSESSSQPPPLMRSKSRTDMSGASSRYQNLSYWKARRLIFYRNGDPFFPGVEYRFKVKEISHMFHAYSLLINFLEN